jgi:threonine synthase
MKYVSTRGASAGLRFSEVLMEGLAADGGLYVPTSYPKVDDATLQHCAAASDLCSSCATVAGD